MAMGRPKAALVLSPEQRAQLESMASSRSLPAGLVTQVRIVLPSAAGKMNQQIARPFVWTATADSIFAKFQRLCERISGTGH